MVELNFTGLNLTGLEQEVLTSFINNLYAEPGFSDVSAEDIAVEIHININSVRGALGSLVKKGIVDIVDMGTGYKIIYLCDDYYYLHPEWSSES